MAVSIPADGLVSLAARERRGGRLSTAALLIGPATIFVTVGLLVPIVILFRYSLTSSFPAS
jgi:putative spermidine/putrescine transport system permease protein